MAKWDDALGGGKLLSRAALEQIWTPARTNDGSAASFGCGFGWFVDSYHGHGFVQHSGGTPGFSSAIYRFLDDGLTVSLLTNHSDRVVDSLVLDIAGSVEPSLHRSVAATDPDPRRTARMGALLADLLAGKHDTDSFTRPMLTLLETSTGKVLWKWIASEGQLEKISYADEETVPGGRLVRDQLLLGANPLWFTVKLADDGRIEQIRWW